MVQCRLIDDQIDCSVFLRAWLRRRVLLGVALVALVPQRVALAHPLSPGAGHAHILSERSSYLTHPLSLEVSLRAEHLLMLLRRIYRPASAQVEV